MGQDESPQQLARAQEMQASNPDLVEQLRQQMQVMIMIMIMMMMMTMQGGPEKKPH